MKRIKEKWNNQLNQGIVMSSLAQRMTGQQIALLEELFSLYKSNILTDVLIAIQDEEIPCHRVVLAASSPYFRAMFTNEVKERHERVVTLHGVSKDIFELIIGYMYMGKIDLTNENVQDIFIAAGMFEMIHLIGQCADHMIQEICISNCVDLFIFGNHFACENLADKAKDFVLEHFADVIRDNDRILDIDYREFESLIYSDDLSVDNEESVFDIIIKWIRKSSDRIKYIYRLFKAVRLPLLSNDFVENTIKKDELINQEHLCKRHLSVYDSYKTSMAVSERDADLLDNYRDDTSSSQETILNATPRLGMFNRSMIIFSGGGNSQDERSLTAFDPVTMKNYLAIKPHPTFEFKNKVDHFNLIVTPDNRIFFLGGIFYDDQHIEINGPALEDVYEYKIKETKWEKRSPMNIKRCLFSSCCHSNCIYVTGGKKAFRRGVPIDSMECYNLEYDYWGSLPPVPINIYKHASCATSDAIFIFGGQDEEDDYLDTVFRYDISYGMWSLVTTQMIKPRAQFSAFCYRNRIYLIGGVTLHENILNVAIYEPNKNRWSFGDDFPEERKISSAAFSDGTIYVCGGVRQLGISGRRCRQVESRDLYKYDIDKNQWTKVVKLVQYGNTDACAIATLNTKFLEKSDYISSI